MPPPRGGGIIIRLLRPCRLQRSFARAQFAAESVTLAPIISIILILKSLQ